MLKRDTAEIIIGTWLSGEHQEDAKLIPVNDFPDDTLTAIAREVRNGEKDPIRIIRRAKAPLTVMSELMPLANETLYESALADIERQTVEEWLDKHRSDDPKDIIAYLQKHTREQSKPVPELPDLADQLVNYVANTLEARASETVMLTGIKELDEMSGGIHKGDLTALGARPSTGKSSFALQVAMNVAKSGGKVIFFSLEMSQDQNIDRMLLRWVQGVDQKTLRSGRLADEQMDEVGRVSDELARLSGRLSFLPERNLTTIEAIVQKHKPDLIVIDQLTQMTDDQTFTDVRSRFTHMTRNLKRIAMENDVAVWLCCQLNRQVGGISRPSMDYLKESGSIEEDSDCVILLSRDEEEEQARGLTGNRIVTVDLCKQRQGELGAFNVKFVVQRFLFKELEDVPGFIETENEVDF